MVKSLGASKVIDYTQDDVTQDGAVYGTVIDAVGKLPSGKARQILKPAGVLINVMKDSDYGGKPNADDLHFLKERIEAGDLITVIDRRYPLADIVEAHRYVEQGHKKDNVVISVVAMGRLLDAPSNRLVTILASGGMGKTRLAIACAESHLEHYADGVSCRVIL